MSHPHCVYINSRCRYQSIAQQYLKRCLIKDDNNYMFRPIRFSSESMVVVLYRICIGMSRWWDLNICDFCYMLLLRGTGGGISHITDTCTCCLYIIATDSMVKGHTLSRFQYMILWHKNLEESGPISISHFFLFTRVFFVMALLKHPYFDDICCHELRAFILSNLCEHGGDLLGSFKCGQLVE